MKYLILFFLFPLMGFTQKTNKGWITPVAEITFDESRIIYSYSADECAIDVVLTPVHYSDRLLALHPVINVGCVDSFRELHQKVYNFVGNWSYGAVSNMDKEDFLKCVSLLIIWQYGNKELLPENTLETVESMQRDMSLKIARDAGLVWKLYHFYQPENRTK